MKHLRILAIMILSISVFCVFTFGDWTGATRLTWTSATAYYPKITTDTNNYIHVVWCTNNPGIYSLFYKKSTNAGADWSSPTRLTYDTGNSLAPSNIHSLTPH